MHHFARRKTLAGVFGTVALIGMFATIGFRARHPGRISDTDWMTTRGDAGGTRYSTLSQITVANVAQLEVAWSYHTQDADPEHLTTIECTPIVIDGILYLTTVRTRVVALDAASGRERWHYDAFTGPPLGPLSAGGVNRGVAHWGDGVAGGQRRILLGTADGRLISIDARTGKPDAAFGRDGVVNMREAIAMEMDLTNREYGMTSPPVIVDDLVICGFSVGENLDDTAPGDIRAFDVRTGRERWRFHTVPRPGETGHDTWAGASWKHRGGANAWAGLTVDPERHLVFAGLGAPSYDYYGGDRAGDNLFANSTIALDTRSGARVWHFQTLHHDVWDWDLPAPPVLVRVYQDGRPVDAAAQITKTGFVYLFDRTTGRPLFPIEERPVRPSDIPGERLAATQPIPVKPPPFARQVLTEEEVARYSPDALAKARDDFGSFRGGQLFAPATDGGSVQFPGLHGGGNWSGASFDPETGWLYINANNDPWTIRLRERAPTPIPFVATDIGQFGDLNGPGHPGIKPPFGTLSAIDLNRGEIAWQVPLGEYRDLAARGIRGSGTENLGGTIVTAGGLVFVASTKDEKIRAFDKRTGDVVWQHQLDAGGYAAPATYAVGGRQFLVIAAGGGGKLKTHSGDAFVAFALPRPRPGTS
jgi:quinoprotein glucose dehydrogenase